MSRTVPADEEDGLSAIAERRHRIEQHTQALVPSSSTARLSPPPRDRARCPRALAGDRRERRRPRARRLSTATRPSSTSVTATRAARERRSRSSWPHAPRTPRTARARALGDRLVEILATHRPDDAAALGDEHSALSVARTTTPSRRGRSAPARPTVEGRRHDVAGAARLLRGLFECGDHQPARFVEIRPQDGRGGLCVPSATEGRRHGGGVHEIAAARPPRTLAAPFRRGARALRVGEVDDLVREVRDPVHVPRSANGCEQELLPAGADRLERLEQVVEEIALAR